MMDVKSCHKHATLSLILMSIDGILVEVYDLVGSSSILMSLTLVSRLDVMLSLFDLGL